MKTITKLITLCAMVVVAHAANAQKGEGGFGYFSAGIGGHIGNDVETRLQSAALFGNTFNLPATGLNFGGKGFGIFSRFIIGGGGYGTSVSASTANGEAELSSGAGFFNFGYLFVKKKKTLFYGFGGIGGGGSTLSIKNTGAVTLAFAANQQIPTGETRKISSGGFGFEAGIGVQQLVISKGDDGERGGFMIGLVAGINYFPSQDWRFEANDTKVSNMGNLSSFYVGITIGGGGISN